MIIGHSGLPETESAPAVLWTLSGLLKAQQLCGSDQSSGSSTYAQHALPHQDTRQLECVKVSSECSHHVIDLHFFYNSFTTVSYYLIFFVSNSFLVMDQIELNITSLFGLLNLVYAFSECVHCPCCYGGYVEQTFIFCKSGYDSGLLYVRC